MCVLASDSSVKMPEICVIKIICVSYLLIVVASVSALYTEYPMESDEICHPFSAKKTHKLDDKDDSAIIIKPISMFNPWTSTVNRICKYVFKTKRDKGLFAVVQNMSFRRNGTECIDWIQFKEDGRKSKRFCGLYNHKNVKYHSISDIENSVIIPNGQWNFSRPEFYSPKGEIETRIFISKERLLPGESLDLRIVYTPYQDCNRVRDKSKYPPNDNNTCIWTGYYCDGYRNCAFDSCLDEARCEFVSDGTGTKVTVGAVTTLILSFLLFVMCLWICRKHKKFCWSPDCAGPNVDGANNQHIDMRPRGRDSRAGIPSAPMLDEVATRSVQDKDLPPSYDSLFPNEPTSTTT